MKTAERSATRTRKPAKAGSADWEILGRTRLPGTTVPCQLAGSPSSQGFAVLGVPTAGRYTAVLRCEVPQSHATQAELAEQWALRLAAEPDVAQTAACVEYATGGGPTAISLAVTRAYRGGSGARRKAGPPAARWFAEQFPVWMRYLASTGASAVRPMAPGELSTLSRLAYDPSIAAFLSASHAPVPDWTDVPPADSSEQWGHFQHEGATSVTWSLSPSSVRAALPQMLEWCASRPAGASAGRACVLAGPSVGAEPDQPSSLQGALVSLTLPGSAEEDWPQWAIASLPVNSRVALRPAYGMQAGAFVAALPLGFGGSRLVRTPRVGK